MGHSVSPGWFISGDSPEEPQYPNIRNNGMQLWREKHRGLCWGRFMCVQWELQAPSGPVLGHGEVLHVPERDQPPDSVCEWWDTQHQDLPVLMQQQVGRCTSTASDETR